MWFVSYVATGTSATGPRRTETFSSEAEAKQFARSRAEAGDQTLMAGTVNPTVPRRVISSASLWEWLDLSPPSTSWRPGDGDS